MNKKYRCDQLEELMDRHGVTEQPRAQYRTALVKAAKAGDCQFAHRCPDCGSCPLGEQKNYKVSAGINPMFPRPDMVVAKWGNPIEPGYRIMAGS